MSNHIETYTDSDLNADGFAPVETRRPGGRPFPFTPGLRDDADRSGAWVILEGDHSKTVADSIRLGHFADDAEKDDYEVRLREEKPETPDAPRGQKAARYVIAVRTRKDA